MTTNDEDRVPGSSVVHSVVDYCLGWAKYNIVRFRNRTALGLMPVHPDDLFVASYPRSGSTWLRTIITNLLVPGAKGKSAVVNDTIPDLGLRNLASVARRSPPRLIKTHSLYAPSISRAIFLVRDVRDVIVSMYHYFVDRRSNSDISFERFLSRYRKGVYGPRWNEHLTTWTRAIDEGADVKALKFRDLKEDTEGVVDEIIDYMGIEPVCSTDEAIRYASLDWLKELERRRTGVDSDDEAFYRSGEVGGWEEMLQGAEGKILLEEIKPHLQSCGFE